MDQYGLTSLWSALVSHDILPTPLAFLDTSRAHWLDGIVKNMFSWKGAANLSPIFVHFIVELLRNLGGGRANSSPIMR